MPVNLITGGAGFIGSHLIDRLLESGEKVICLDNLFTGRLKNINCWMDNKNFDFIEHDVVSPINLNVDKIWHLACQASPVHYQFNPIKTMKTSFMGTFNMLGLAKKQGAKILFASTSEVYGDPEIHPQPESYKGSVNTLGVRSCYDEGKRIAETLCSDYKRVHNVEAKIVRIFNTYGPRMREDDGRVVSNFIVQALKEKPITIYGNGNQTRSFCYVDDLINGLILAMNTSYENPINLGYPEEFTINNLAEIIRTRINPSLKVVYKKLPEDDPFQRKPVIEKAKNILNWYPKIDLEFGLDLTIDYFVKELNLKLS